MWLFVDETWSPQSLCPAFGIMLGVLVQHDQLEQLDRFLFAVRRKYYGEDHARNLHHELKGKDLFSN